MKRQPRLFHLLQLAHSTLFKAADRSLMAAHGISSAQQGALFFIGAHDGCLMSELARGLAFNKSAATALCSRLEAAGLIDRRADADDGRATRLHLTDAGREKMRASLPLLQTANQFLLDGFSDKEIAVVERFLAHVIDGASRFADNITTTDRHPSPPSKRHTA